MSEVLSLISSFYIIQHNLRCHNGSLQDVVTKILVLYLIVFFCGVHYICKRESWGRSWIAKGKIWLLRQFIISYIFPSWIALTVLIFVCFVRINIEYSISKGNISFIFQYYSSAKPTKSFKARLLQWKFKSNIMLRIDLDQWESARISMKWVISISSFKTLCLNSYTHT